jgi:hypothetical protein
MQRTFEVMCAAALDPENNNQESTAEQSLFEKGSGNLKEQKYSDRHKKLSAPQDPGVTRALLGALRNFLNETGISHSELAHELGISPGEILGWMHGNVELRTATLVSIRIFLETNGPAYLRATQRENKEDEEETKWHSFLQDP